MRFSRNKKGMATAEFAVSAIALGIMVIVSVDVGICMMANQVLDKAARDAARAAAAATPVWTVSSVDYTNVINAAKAALATHQTDGTYITQPSLVSAVPASDPPAAFVYHDNAGTPVGQTIPAGYPDAGQVADNPYVIVTTQCTATLPANLSFLGQSLFQGPIATGKMTFVRQYQFPIVSQCLNSNFQ